MKTRNGYLINSLIMQMFVVPLLLTAMFIWVFPLGEKAISGFGKDAKTLLYIIIVIIGSLIAGGITALIFSKLSKQRSEDKNIVFITPLLPIVYSLIFAVGLMILTGNDYNSKYWLIYVLKNPFFLLVDGILSFMGKNFIIPIVDITGYAGYAIVYMLLNRKLDNDEDMKLSNNMKIFLIGLSIAIVAFVGMSARDKIEFGLIELRYGKSTFSNELTEFDLTQIAPFRENNGLAKLDKKSSLQFEKLEDMPQLDGATAAYPVYAAFVEAVYKGLGDYYKENKDIPGKEIYDFDAFVKSDTYPINIIKCSKTSGAFIRLIEGETDIIFVAEPSKAQLEAITAKGDEFVLTPIGYEAFVFFTNSANSIDSLTIEQIQDIYTGKTTNWKEVGGKSGEILPFQRPEDSGSQTIMQNKVMKGAAMTTATMETEVGGMGGMINKVANYKNAKNAIGYSFLYYSSAMIKNNQIKYIGVNGIKPTSETVRNKTYPFTVPVYAVTLKSNTNENVQKFIAWILSVEGQGIIEKTGYIPVSE